MGLKNFSRNKLFQERFCLRLFARNFYGCFDSKMLEYTMTKNIAIDYCFGLCL